MQKSHLKEFETNDVMVTVHYLDENNIPVCIQIELLGEFKINPSGENGGYSGTNKRANMFSDLIQHRRIIFDGEEKTLFIPEHRLLKIEYTKKIRKEYHAIPGPPPSYP